MAVAAAIQAYLISEEAITVHGLLSLSYSLAAVEMVTACGAMMAAVAVLTVFGLLSFSSYLATMVQTDVAVAAN